MSLLLAWGALCVVAFLCVVVLAYVLALLLEALDRPAEGSTSPGARPAVDETGAVEAESPSLRPRSAIRGVR